MTALKDLPIIAANAAVTIGRIMVSCPLAFEKTLPKHFAAFCMAMIGCDDPDEQTSALEGLFNFLKAKPEVVEKNHKEIQEMFNGLKHPPASAKKVMDNILSTFKF